MGLKSAHFEVSHFQESGEGDRFLKMGTLISNRDRALLKMVWQLHGQAFVYIRRICGY